MSSITSTSAKSGGEVNSDGGSSIVQKGVCWSTTSSPTIANEKTTDGSGTAAFTSNLTNLSPGTKYFVKAYASNSLKTGYGEQRDFTTPTLSTITTTAVTAITTTTATSGGNIASDGGSPITARGVCWSTSTGPTISGSKTVEIGTTGIFASSFSGLTANVTYYIRAYATNSAGTGYGNELTFKTLAPPATIQDYEGNIYKTLIIGTQIWLAENLKSTKYNDGTSIPFVIDNTIWANISTPAYSWNNNDAATNKSVYGALYNWYTVATGKLCPTGWHVPTDTEWTLLTTFLGGVNAAGGKLKEAGTSHWNSPNTGATNESGFTALPAGYRWPNGGFDPHGNFANWWTATEFSVAETWYRNLGYFHTDINRVTLDKHYGFYIRCIKD